MNKTSNQDRLYNKRYEQVKEKKMGGFARMSAAEFQRLIHKTEKNSKKEFTYALNPLTHARKVAKREREKIKKTEEEPKVIKTASKFKAEKIKVDGITYDSKKEARRQAELDLMVSCSQISGLTRQRAFILQPGFIDNEGHKQRPIKYVCDFFYFDKSLNKWVVEDVKSEYTRNLPVYKIKKKLFLMKYPQYKFYEYV